MIPPLKQPGESGKRTSRWNGVTKHLGGRGGGGGEEDNAPRIASSNQIIASSWSRIAIIDSPDI
jgi:hypothetical protein